jgi:hypothetical protein
MVKEANDSADKEEPIEVWLTKRNIGVTCGVVNGDESATELDVDSLLDARCTTEDRRLVQQPGLRACGPVAREVFGRQRQLGGDVPPVPLTTESLSPVTRWVQAAKAAA